MLTRYEYVPMAARAASVAVSSRTAAASRGNSVRAEWPARIHAALREGAAAWRGFGPVRPWRLGLTPYLPPAPTTLSKDSVHAAPRSVAKEEWRLLAELTIMLDMPADGVPC